MERPTKKAALIEIGGSHSECLYSQLLFLTNGGYEVLIVADEKTAGQLTGFDLPYQLLSVERSGGWKTLLQIRKKLIREGYSTVIFNTAQSSAVRNLLLLPYPRHFRFTGILHHLNKLQSGSVSQQIISRRVRSYFLLNDYLVEKAAALPARSLRFQSCYTIFFPPYKQAPLNKRPGSLWINIPGHIEYQRRDYESLVRAFAALAHKPDYLFLLGNGSHRNGNGPGLKELVLREGVAEHFIFWDGFVEPAEFHSYLRLSDAVMPLIHPASSDMHKYLNEQISGNFNLAFAYRKPLLLHRAFGQFADFRENAIFYDLVELPELLKDLPLRLAGREGNRYRDPKWSEMFQSERYLSAIGS